LENGKWCRVNGGIDVDRLAEDLSDRVGSKISKLISKIMRKELNSRLPPSYEMKKFTDEIQILINAASYGRKRVWKSVLVTGTMVMKKDLMVKDVVEILRCDRTTAYRIFRRLLESGFVEKDGRYYRLNGKTCPVLYSITRRTLFVVRE
jgi:hypothetical protein